jgi:hypothetical protein
MHSPPAPVPNAQGLVRHLRAGVAGFNPIRIAFIAQNI